MRNKHNTLIYIGISIIFLISNTGIVSANDINVYPEGSIQAAIKNASSGSTIIVHPGIYSENIEIKRSLSIISKSGSPNDTIIKAENPNYHIFHVNASNVTICGFTITGAFEEPEDYYFPDRGINVSIFNETSDKDEVVHSSDGQWGIVPKNWAGICVDGTDNNIITDNTILGNNRGILIKSSNNNLIENNTAINNDGAISIWYSSDFNSIINNKISFDEITMNKYGISLIESKHNEIHNNNLLNLDITLLQSDDNNVINNTINFGVWGIHLIESTSNNVCCNSISETSNGIILRDDSNSNTLSDNAVFENSMGIRLESCSNNNTISENILKNDDDIYFSDCSDNNNIYKNKIEYSKYLTRSYAGNIIMISVSAIIIICAFILLLRK